MQPCFHWRVPSFITRDHASKKKGLEESSKPFLFSRFSGREVRAFCR